MLVMVGSEGKLSNKPAAIIESPFLKQFWYLLNPSCCLLVQNSVLFHQPAPAATSPVVFWCPEPVLRFTASPSLVLWLSLSLNCVIYVKHTRSVLWKALANEVCFCLLMCRERIFHFGEGCGNHGHSSLRFTGGKELSWSKCSQH